MRSLVIGVALGLCWQLPVASAQTTSVSGAVGGGVIDDEPVALASAELDVVSPGESFAVGLALRARVVDGVLLATDWDELSDAGRVIRYLTWRRRLGARSSLSLAVGHLGEVTLGNGSLVGGYASGVDFDRGRAGAELRVRVGRGEAHAIVDDVTRAELVAARALAPIASSDAWVLGVSGVVDRTTETLLASTDLQLRGEHGWARAAVYGELATRAREGAGAHVGVRLGASSKITDVEIRGEARASQAGYIPGWVSPLYLRDRDQAGDAMSAPGLTEVADRHATGGLSWMAAASLETSLARAQLEFATRPGLPWLLSGRLRLPAFRDVQAGAWFALEGERAIEGPMGTTVLGSGAALAAEVRARLPRSLFVRAELSRQYSRATSATAGESKRWAALWLATASLGAVLGE